EHQIASSHHEHTVHGLDSAQELHGWTVVPYLWIPGDTPHGLGVPAGDEQLGPLGVEGHSVRVFDLAGEDREVLPCRVGDVDSLGGRVAEHDLVVWGDGDEVGGLERLELPTNEHAGVTLGSHFPDHALSRAPRVVLAAHEQIAVLGKRHSEGGFDTHELAHLASFAQRHDTVGA